MRLEIESHHQLSLLNFFRRRKGRPEDQIQYFITDKKDPRQVKAHVNGVFFKQLKYLLGERKNTHKVPLSVTFFFEKYKLKLYNVLMYEQSLKLFLTADSGSDYLNYQLSDCT